MVGAGWVCASVIRGCVSAHTDTTTARAATRCANRSSMSSGTRLLFQPRQHGIAAISRQTGGQLPERGAHDVAVMNLRSNRLVGIEPQLVDQLHVLLGQLRRVHAQAERLAPVVAAV